MGISEMSIAAMFESVKRYCYVADAKEYRDVDVHLKREEKVTDTIAHAGNFTSDTVRPENLFTDEIIIHTAPEVKSITELWDRNPKKTI